MAIKALAFESLLVLTHPLTDIFCSSAFVCNSSLILMRPIIYIGRNRRNEKLEEKRKKALQEKAFPYIIRKVKTHPGSVIGNTVDSGSAFGGSSPPRDAIMVA